MTSTITVNMDKACTQCGQMGAANGGICLECVADNLKKISSQGSGQLTALALGKGISDLSQHIVNHATKIHMAYLKSDDAKVSVGLKMELSSTRPGRIDIKTDITFIESKVKDSSESHVVEGQEELPMG
jgi:hypothetical protein